MATLGVGVSENTDARKACLSGCAFRKPVTQFPGMPER
jgi:hypothetical protein